MALTAKHNEINFGVGDTVRVVQKIKEGDKERTQAFQGMVIAIRGENVNKSFTVRRIGVQKIGIERIFPLFSPLIKEVEVIREGTKGVRNAKLYYTRNKSKKEIEKIYLRASRKDLIKKTKKPKSVKKVSKKKALKKTTKNASKKK